MKKALLLLLIALPALAQNYYDRSGSYQGREDNGRFYDRSGSYQGQQQNGRFYDKNGSYRGSKR